MSSKAAQDALEGLAALVPDALSALSDSLKNKKRERGSGNRSPDARYVLDVILDRLQPSAEGEGKDSKPRLTAEQAMEQLRLRLVGGGGKKG